MDTCTCCVGEEHISAKQEKPRPDAEGEALRAKRRSP